MNFHQKKIDVKNLEKENELVKDINKKINISNKSNKINYFNRSSKNGQNKVNNNISSQKKICINISETKKNLDNKNINRINNIDNLKKENIKRTELFKPKSKNKFIQNFYSNTTNTNTNNTNKKSNNNTNSINNNNKQNENKDDKIFIDSNTNNTNSYSNQKEILYESVELDQLNNILASNTHKINNKRNKSFKKGELLTLDSLKSYNKKNMNNTERKKSDFNFQTYTIPFKKNIIKVNMVNNNEKDNKIRKYIKPKLNINSKSSTNLKTNLNNNDYLVINTDFKYQIKDKHSFSITNSEKNLKLITNNNIRLSSNSISKSTKNTLNIKIYLPSYNNRKKLKKKKTGKSFSHINVPKEIVQLSTNRSLDMKHKNSYLVSSRVNTQRKSKDNKINTKNIIIDLNPEQNNKNDLKYSSKPVIVPEYKIKLDAIKSRIYKLLNIYSLIALKSINNNSNGNNNNGDDDRFQDNN